MLTKRHTLRKPAGHSTRFGPEGQIEHDTGRCCHCGKHWEVSVIAHISPFCTRCNAPTCEDPRCTSTCVPVEKFLEKLEDDAQRWRPPAKGSRILIP